MAFENFPYNLDYLPLQHCSLGPDLHTQLQSLMQAQLPPHFTVEHWQAKMVNLKLVSYHLVVGPISLHITYQIHNSCNPLYW